MSIIKELKNYWSITHFVLGCYNVYCLPIIVEGKLPEHQSYKIILQFYLFSKRGPRAFFRNIFLDTIHSSWFEEAIFVIFRFYRIDITSCNIMIAWDSKTFSYSYLDVIHSLFYQTIEILETILFFFCFNLD